jgi:hypothetical protein
MKRLLLIPILLLTLMVGNSAASFAKNVQFVSGYGTAIQFVSGYGTGIDLVSSQQSANLSICFPSGFKYDKRHIASIVYLYYIKPRE